MSKHLEIHRITVEDSQVSTSVQGSVSGASYQGTGTVSGSTQTSHTSSIFANGKSYQLKQTNQQYPFRTGDDIVAVCSRNNKTGIYEIGALVNLTNDTRLIPGIVAPHFYFWGVFVLSIPLIFLLIGLLLAPISLGLGIWYSFFHYPKLKRAFAELNNVAAATQDQIDYKVAEANRLLAVT